jgi:hypothetical protein
MQLACRKRAMRKSRAAVKESAAQCPAYLRQPTSGGLERRARERPVPQWFTLPNL